MLQTVRRRACLPNAAPATLNFGLKMFFRCFRAGRPSSIISAITTDPSARVAAVTAVVPHPPAGLVGAMIGASARHSRRKAQRRFRIDVAKKTNRIIERASPFFRPHPSATRINDTVAVKVGAQFLNVSGVLRRVLTGEIHFANKTGGSHAALLASAASESGDKTAQEQKEMGSHYRNYKQARCQPGPPIFGQASLRDRANPFSPITYVATGQVLQCGAAAPLSRNRATEAEHDHHNL